MQRASFAALRAELESAQRAEVDALSLLRAVFDVAFHAAMAVDAQGVVVEWSRGAELQFKASRAEAVGQGGVGVQ